MRTIRDISFLAPVEFGALGPKRKLTEIPGSSASLNTLEGVPGVEVASPRGVWWVPLAACAIEWERDDRVPLTLASAGDADGAPVTEQRERGRKRR